jgi:NADH dehydrogenase FAD-containing subunit
VFVPDQTKAGGSYIEITDTVKRVDMTAKKIVLISTRASGINNTIDFDKIVSIHGDQVDYLDE